MPVATEAVATLAPAVGDSDPFPSDDVDPFAAEGGLDPFAAEDEDDSTNKTSDPVVQTVEASTKEDDDDDYSEDSYDDDFS